VTSARSPTTAPVTTPVKTLVHNDSCGHGNITRQRIGDRTRARLPPTTTSPLTSPSHYDFLTSDYTGTGVVTGALTGDVAVAA